MKNFNEILAKVYNLLLNFNFKIISEYIHFLIYKFDRFIAHSIVFVKYLFEVVSDVINTNLYLIGKSKVWNVFVDRVYVFLEAKVKLFNWFLTKYTYLFYSATVGFLIISADWVAKSVYGPQFMFVNELITDFKWILGVVGAEVFLEVYLIPVFFVIVFLGFFIVPHNLNTPELTPKVVALAISLLIFVLVLLKTFLYDFSLTFEVSSHIFVGEKLSYLFPVLFFVFDPLSLAFSLLVSFIFPIVILSSWEKINTRVNFFYFNVIILELLVLGAFFTLDIFLFFIFFEAMFIPMVLIILIWGSRQRKVKASSYIFLYTIFGSAFFLTGIVYLYNVFGSTNYFYILNNLDMLSKNETILLWFTFFIPFAIKIPMFPFHIWLPEAHVEAPTSGSIVLAAVLLKLGGYGFIRFLIPMFHDVSVFFSPVVITLALIGVIYASLTASRQTDLKKIIAYSSVAHMNFVVVGIFSFNINSLFGSVMLMLSHGIVSSGLFFLAGVLYDRYHTRSIIYYGGLVQVMPLFSSFLFYFVIANFGFPCSLSFIGEFFIFLGVFKELGLLVSLILSITTVLSVYFNMLIFLSICFGTMNNKINNIYQDLSSRELKILLSLVTTSLFLFFFHSIYASLFIETTTLHFHLYF